VVFAIVDLVSRKWIDTLVSVEETATQVQVLFEHALEIEGLIELLTDERLDLDSDDPGRPILLAVSDNGPPMTAQATRAFMALMAIAQHHGRPHTPTDQAWIESFFGHIKGEWPHLEAIADSTLVEIELARVRTEYNSVRIPPTACSAQSTTNAPAPHNLQPSTAVTNTTVGRRHEPERDGFAAAVSPRPRRAEATGPPLRPNEN
jgi:hypothetical protein